MDPVCIGVSVGLTACNKHLTKLKLHCMDIKFTMLKSFVGFGDLDLVIKVTVGCKLANLSQDLIVIEQIIWTSYSDLEDGKGR